MKITFMTSGTIYSSISYRPLSLAKQLQKKGHDVSIFAPRFDKYSKFKDEQITEVAGVKIIRPLQLAFLPFDLSLISYIVSSIILLIKHRPDVIHIYKPNPITLSSLIPHIVLGTPLIFDTDDIDSEVMIAEKSSKVKIFLVKLSESIAAKQANAIIIGSQFLQNLYTKQYPKKLVAYIPNGADFTHTNTIQTKNISDNRIIFVGAINRINILEPLFFAVQKIVAAKKPVEVIIMGDGTYLPYFKTLVKKLQIEKQVTFLGWVAQNTLQKHIQVGDIGYSYMPDELTIKACSSMKVFQYMQYGAVPLVSNVGDFPAYTFNGKAGFIAKHSNITSLHQTLMTIMNNKNQKREKISYAKEHGKNTYAWNVLTEKVEAVYKRIV